MKASTDRKIGRISALLLFGLSLAFGLSARNNSVTTTGERPAVTCGVMGCSGYVGTKGGIKGGVKGTGAGGGGTIHVGS